MINPNYRHFSEFQRKLVRKFRREEASYDTAELAIFLGKSYDTADRYIGNRLPIYADLARDINRFILAKNSEDRELLQFFCPPGFTVTKTPDGNPITNDERREKMIKLVTTLSNSLESIERAYEDGILDNQESKEIDLSLDIHMQRIIDFKKTLKRR